MMQSWTTRLAQSFKEKRRTPKKGDNDTGHGDGSMKKTKKKGIDESRRRDSHSKRYHNSDKTKKKKNNTIDNNGSGLSSGVGTISNPQSSWTLSNPSPSSVSSSSTSCKSFSSLWMFERINVHDCWGFAFQGCSCTPASVVEKTTRWCLGEESEDEKDEDRRRPLTISFLNTVGHLELIFTPWPQLVKVMWS